MSTECLECPICMDPIEITKNCTTTDCGHCFHASCLMTSVAHNGFACPYCRTKMAEEVADEESDYDDEEEEEMFDDDALRGFRLFMNNLDGDAHDEEDIEEENEYEEENNEEEEDNEEVTTAPNASFVAQKLTQQGVTMEDLVKILMIGHDEYDHQSEELERCDNEMFGRLRAIISNYSPQQNV
jgi:hypothetical protein